jgi:hypothetical protein
MLTLTQHEDLRKGAPGGSWILRSVPGGGRPRYECLPSAQDYLDHAPSPHLLRFTFQATEEDMAMDLTDKQWAVLEPFIPSLRAV